MAVCPAKTQISLGIRPVWSEPSLSAWRRTGSLATHWAHSEDSDQTGKMPRLIWVFAGRTLILLVLSCRGSYFVSKQQKPHYPTLRFAKEIFPRAHFKKIQALWYLFSFFVSFAALLVMTVGVKFLSGRKFNMIGGTVLCIAYTISSRVEDVRLLLFSHGVLQGE